MSILRNRRLIDTGFSPASVHRVPWDIPGQVTSFGVRDLRTIVALGILDTVDYSTLSASFHSRLHDLHLSAPWRTLRSLCVNGFIWYGDAPNGGGQYIPIREASTQ